MTTPTPDSTPSPTRSSSQPRPLTDRQERFIHEYMLDQNASAAALRCGYAPGSCRAQGAALMRDARIRERVTEGLEALFERLDITAARVLGERARAAFFDPLCLVDGQGNPVPLGELSPEVKAALVISYRVRGGVPELFVRHVNRNPALTVLERRLAQLEVLQRERAQAQAEAAAEAQRQAEEQAQLARGPVRFTPEWARKGERVEERAMEVRRGAEVGPEAEAGVEIHGEAQVGGDIEAVAAPVLAALPVAPATVPLPGEGRRIVWPEEDRPLILPVLDYPEPDTPRATFGWAEVAPGRRVGVPKQRSRQRYAVTEDSDPWGD